METRNQQIRVLALLTKTFNHLRHIILLAVLEIIFPKPYYLSKEVIPNSIICNSYGVEFRKYPTTK